MEYRSIQKVDTIEFKLLATKSVRRMERAIGRPPRIETKTN